MDATHPTQPALTPAVIEAIIVQTVAVLKGVDGRLSPSKEAQDMPSAWIDQDSKQVKKYGMERASH